MDNSRQWHIDADGQTVGVNDAFIVMGEEMDCPGDDAGSPENVINCHCDMAYATEGVEPAAAEPAEPAEAEAAEVARTLHDSAVEREEKTTAMINNIAKATGGDTFGLEFAVKSEESIARKLGDYLKENPTFTLEDAVANVTDSLRYTITYDPENLVDNVLKSHELLKGEGYEPIKLKNYFNSKESGYRGYNTVWQDKVGNKIEVQYHTEESVRIKEAVHKDYEAYRIENDLEKKEALLQKMEGAWDNFTPPKDYTKLPGVMEP